MTESRSTLHSTAGWWRWASHRSFVTATLDERGPLRAPHGPTVPFDVRAADITKQRGRRSADCDA